MKGKGILYGSTRVAMLAVTPPVVNGWICGAIREPDVREATFCLWLGENHGRPAKKQVSHMNDDNARQVRQLPSHQGPGHSE